MKIILFYLYLLFPFSFGTAPSEFYPEKEAAKIVKSVLKEKEITFPEKWEMENLTGERAFLIVYKLGKTESVQNEYAVFTQAKGRYELFDYLLILAADFTVQKVSIVKYRSERGGEIASKKWLKQFENYSSGELRYGKEISALSGATLSASSITSDIPMVVEMLKEDLKVKVSGSN